MVTKNFLNVFALVFLLAGLLTACGNNNNSIIVPPAATPAPEAVLLATGGTGTAGSGGSGGYVYIDSYGTVTVSKAGTVDASIDTLVSAPVLSFGTNSFVVSAGTTTVLDTDTNDGSPHLYVKSGDPYLYLGNGDGITTNDPAVTGLIVDVGATLVLADQNYCGGGPGCPGYATLQLLNDMVVNGTVITNAATGLYIEANVIDVESSGNIVTSATTTDSNAGEIYLGYGNGITKQIINHGTIDAKGLGIGSGGHTYLRADDLVVNYGTVDTSGGTSDTGPGGSGGEFDIYVDYGNFYSSGTVRTNGGNGGDGNNGGNAGPVYIYTANQDNTLTSNGDIIISGTWEANGGDGTNGNGGAGGYLSFETDALGAITMNASMSAKGGSGKGTGFSGGNATGIDIYSENYASAVDPEPGKITISGHYDLRGGDGDQGGSGGYLEIYGADASNGSGFGPNVELVNFPAMNLNGGEGVDGGAASDQAVEIYTDSPGSTPPGAITNQSTIYAKGGNSTAGGTGGTGGYIEMYYNSGTPDANTVINNSGTIDISGGTGDTGGDTYGFYSGNGDSIYLDAQHVTNTGSIIANGGKGTTTGGGGGDIYLYSEDNATPTTPGRLSAAGGAPDGTAGYIYVDGNQI